MRKSSTRNSAKKTSHKPFGFAGFIFLALLLAGCAGPTASTADVTTASPSTAMPPTAIPTAVIPTATNPPAPTLGAPTATPVETLPSPTTKPSAPPAMPGRLPNPDLVVWSPIVTGMDSPVGLTHAGDGSGRLFIVQQDGRIRIVRNGVLLEEAFLDITDRVGRNGNEQGLLGLAFHPRYTENRFFYVNYTDDYGDTIIARFRASDDNPDRARPASELVLLKINQPYPNHNGGEVAFGPDGYLYLGLGDGGSGGDPQNNGQNLDSRLGKILRIDVDSAEPYAIPPDNPYANGGGRPEIWAAGLRNPWRFSFDRLTGDLYIADVGQNQWEEINFLPAGSPGGANFGWRFFEADMPYEGRPPAGLEVIAPVASYDHSQGCSVTGGFVYRGTALQEWPGVYLYGDFCTGLVWGIRPAPGGEWVRGLLFETGANITSFGEDEAGEIYLLDRGGTIYRLEMR
jgi:glucose/arabinose dehydrogenase